MSSSASERTLTLSLRAIWLGAVIDIAGSLMLTTVIGLTAVTAMLVGGASAQTIVEQLPHSFALVLFCAAGGIVMSLAGGYAAARIAPQGPLVHAFLAGLLAAILNTGMIILLGDSGPIWLTATTTALILPSAIFGGWLAIPVN